MKQKDLTHGGIVHNIMVFALPYILAYFLQILYGLADLFIIGQYCSVDATTAVSNGAQVMYFVTVVVIGLAMGTTVRMARAVGAEDRRWAAQIMGNSITLFMTVAVALLGILLLSTNAIVHMMQTPSEAVSGTHDYLTVCFIGIPFIVAYNIIASVFRGIGDTQTPLFFVVVACVANIVFDYLFIGYWGMGPMGAALGTTLSQTISVLYAIVAIRRHKEIFNLTRADLKPRRQVLSDILKIGVPVALQDGFIQVSFILIAIIANTRGLDDAAAVGIVEKVIGLLFIVPSAMLSTVSAISAQNIGAGHPERARLTMKRAIQIVIGFGACCVALVYFNPEMLVRLFTDNDHVAQQGADYLSSYSIDCMLAGIHFCFSGFFTAYNYSMVSFAHNVISIVTARVPLSYVFSVMYPTTLFPMGLAAPIGSVVSIIVCVGAYYYMSRKGMLSFKTTA